VWSTFGHCVKNIRVVSAIRALLDSYSIELGTGILRGLMIGQSVGEKFAKISPINNVY
jgi:hypothetical protein